jgi:hypothetical protein
LAAALSSSLPHWAAQMGIDLWGAEESERWLRREQDRSDELAERLSLILSRVEMKEQIANELVEGRMTLVEAARAFLPVQKRAEELGARSPDMLIDLPDEERICRMLIACVENRAPLEHSRESEIVTRLRSELEEYLLAGPLHLAD